MTTEKKQVKYSRTRGDAMQPRCELYSGRPRGRTSGVIYQTWVQEFIIADVVSDTDPIGLFVIAQISISKDTLHKGACKDLQ
jgi:hypothetical protein